MELGPVFGSVFPVSIGNKKNKKNKKTGIEQAK